MRAAIMITFVLLCPVASGSTIIVPDDYATIQEAIDAAVNGDTVLVRPGTYVENITFNKNIEVVSEAGPASTLIDGNNGDMGILFAPGASGSGTLLDGFTITNCGSGTSSSGSAVFCGTYSPTIRNNIIRDNTYTYWLHSGSGISINNGSPEIYNNVIKDNTTPGWGGGIYMMGGNAQIWNNVITGNSASNGGGITLNYWATGTILNNLIYDNDASTAGGGLVVVDNSTATVVNTIFWNNSSPKGEEIHLNGMFSPVTVTISYCDVDGGQLSIDEDGFTTLNWGAGMIDSDPLFVDAVGNDFHLTYPSPCRDAGDNSAVTGLFDFEGDPRIAFGTVDIGVDEFYSHLYCVGDFMAGGSIEGRFIGVPATWPVGLFIGSGVMDPPLHHMWGDFYLESPWILIPLVPIPANGVLEIPASLPLTPAPYDIPMQALIGWELSNLFVVEVR